MYGDNVEVIAKSEIYKCVFKFILYLKAKSLNNWLLSFVKLKWKEMYICCVAMNWSLHKVIRQ
jgi:hypothetical protein